MGMAASQARLLSLTARQHDVEYQAQAIQHAKIQLATQQDRVYEEYQAALDAQSLTLNSINPQTGTTSIVAATFNNLFSSRRLTPATRTDALNPSTYILLDRNGRLVVEDDIYDGYYNFMEEGSGYPQTAQAFAMYMLFGGEVDPSTLIEAERATFYDGSLSFTTEQLTSLNNLRDEILTKFGIAPATEDRDGHGDGTWYNIYQIPEGVELEDFEYNEYKNLLNQYLSILYSGQGLNSVYRHMAANEQGIEVDDLSEDVAIDTAQFNYYMHIFQTIESCGGCVSIEDFNGFNGNAANDADWLTSMVSSGLMTVSTVTTDRRTGELIFNATAPSSDENLSYAATSSIDNAAVKKAEAKYEHDLKQIERKDKKFDLDLSKLDTERNALKTEYESVKKVIENNIERSFGIFS